MVLLVGCVDTNQTTPPFESRPEGSIVKTPEISIHDAVRDGNIEAIKKHISAGTNLNKPERNKTKKYIPNSSRDSALDLAMKLPLSNIKSNTVDLLKKNGAKTTKQLNKQLKFIGPCRSGDIVVMKKLIKEGALINCIGSTGNTPLNLSVTGYYGDITVRAVKFLIDKGADVNFIDAGGAAPLHNFKLKEVGDLLIKNGANLNAKTNKGHTPLHTAVLLSHFEPAEFLISNGANVNAIDYNDQTPLDFAKMWEDISTEDSSSIEEEMANMLINSIKNDADNKKIIELLRKHGGQTNEELNRIIAAFKNEHLIFSATVIFLITSITLFLAYRKKRKKNESRCDGIGVRQGGAPFLVVREAWRSACPAAHGGRPHAPRHRAARPHTLPHARPHTTARPRATPLRRVAKMDNTRVPYKTAAKWYPWRRGRRLDEALGAELGALLGDVLGLWLGALLGALDGA